MAILNEDVWHAAWEYGPHIPWENVPGDVKADA
jgi:hypothetical protein